MGGQAGANTVTYWERLSSTSLERIDRSVPVVLPLGAVEQHGPHLPVATDRMIADYFCAELDRRLGEQLLILPTVTVGYSHHHDDFPGTLSVSHETLARQIIELAESALRHGFASLLIVNAHGGNEGTAQVALEYLGHQWPDRTIVRTTWWQVAAADLREISETGPGGVGHACEFETSLMLAIEADLVDLEAAPARKNAPAFAWDTSDMLRSGPAVMYRRFGDISPTGVFGDPRAASRAKGEHMSVVIAERLSEVVVSLRRAAPA